MKTLVIFDSQWGNTEKIARAMAGALTGEVLVKSAATASAADLQKIDLLLIGSATQGGRFLKPTQALLEGVKESDIKGLNTASYDTRLTGNFVKIFGWAAKKIADVLKKKGAAVIAEPEGFFVKGKEGPIMDGELERAAEWAKKVQASVSK
jgi:flavodoxin I